MNRISPVIMAFVLAVSIIGGVPLAGAVGPSDAGTVDAQPDDEKTDESNVPVGERLSGIVAVQEAELDGEIESRAFGLQVARAETDEAKAAIIAEQLGTNEEQLADIEERMTELREQREAGDISDGQYRAEMAPLAAKTMQVERLANEAATTGEELPADVLQAQGVNADAIEQPREEANDTRNGEVGDIARSIAGENVGQSGGESGELSPAGEQADTPGGATDALDRGEQELTAAEERIETAERQVNEGDEDAQEALDGARDALASAAEALGDAEEAAEAGDNEEAIERADEATDHADAALDLAAEAVDRASDASTDGRESDDRDGSSAQGDAGGDAERQ